MSSYQLEINGKYVDAYYPDDDIRDVYIPLLKEWSSLQKQQGRRIIVFIAAPAGCGKSTLVSFLEQLAREHGIAGVQALGMDGFHYPQAYLNTHEGMLDGSMIRLADIKGHPLTFDVQKLKDTLASIQREDGTWPYYSRKIHDPIEDAIRVTGNIILLEGNYLLYEEELWNGLSRFCDASLFLRMEEDVLIKRIIERRVQTGRSIDEATRTVYASDVRNIRLVLNHRKPADHEIVLNSDNRIAVFH